MTPEITRALGSMVSDFHRFLKRYVRHGDPIPAEAAAAWGSALVAKHPISMRRIVADGRATFNEGVLDVPYWEDLMAYDDVEVFDVFDETARGEIWRGIEAALGAPAPGAQCSPVLFADWVERTSPEAAADVAGWIGLVTDLVPDDERLRETLGTHELAFAEYRKRSATLERDLRANVDAVRAVLKHEVVLSGASNLDRVLAALGANARELREVSVARDVDRRLLLRQCSGASRRLVETRFWQQLPEDLIDRWLINGGLRFLTIDKDTYSYKTVEFWLAVAQSSRSFDDQRAILELAVQIAELHCDLVFRDVQRDYHALFPGHHAAIAAFRAGCSAEELAIATPS